MNVPSHPWVRSCAVLLLCLTFASLLLTRLCIDGSSWYSPAEVCSPDGLFDTNGLLAGLWGHLQTSPALSTLSCGYLSKKDISKEKKSFKIILNLMMPFPNVKMACQNIYSDQETQKKHFPVLSVAVCSGSCLCSYALHFWCLVHSTADPKVFCLPPQLNWKPFKS